METLRTGNLLRLVVRRIMRLGKGLMLHLGRMVFAQIVLRQENARRKPQNGKRSGIFGRMVE
ncbi:MAG: hypothetical protein DWQ41_08610 [Planctomycetota bacterium]|nr:MAG: hypothetical protein DWQ41_08610 [Planctomycetota bacterium]